MAANDYYHSHPRPYRDNFQRLDSSNQSLSYASPVSPQEGHSYPFSYQQKPQPYAGSGGRVHDDPDVYEEGNSMSMNERRAKHESTQTITPILPPEVEDPFVRDVDPRKKRRRKGGKDGWFTGQITWAVYALSLVELIVFIAEIIKNAVLTKSPIEIHPSFNPMIGPSPYVLINMGARYQPCMHKMANVQNSTTQIFWPCPNATSTTGASVSCSLSDLCGFGGVPNPQVGADFDDAAAPNQWWRFIVPIFLHAGIIHIGFNLLLQLTLGRDVEKLIGTIRFTILYFAAGIFGFVLGGNFAATGIASTGCSGSLFGILAITLLDLLYTWKERPSPVKDLLFILFDVAISFVLGLLPGLDNFSHIGGFLMGLVLGVCILRSPATISRRTSSRTHVSVPHSSRNGDKPSGIQDFVKDPVGFFRGRQGIWWIWWLVRALALVGILIGFILLLKNFYVWMNGCAWCKYLSCLPIKVGNTNWCSVGNLNFTPQNQTANSKRDLLDLTKEVFEVARHL